MTRFGRVGTESSRSAAEYAELVSPRKRWLRKNGKWLFPILLVILGGAGWSTDHFYLAPARDEQRVAHALQLLELDPVFKSAWAKNISEMSVVDQQFAVMTALDPAEKERGDPAVVQAYRSALRVAMRHGIPEAKLKLGKALRDGTLGEPDATAALKVFEKVAREIDAGVRVGDPVSMYVRAQMLSEGLGVEPNAEKARELATRAGSGLKGYRLAEIARSAAWGRSIFEGNKDLRLAEALASRMIDQKMANGPWVGATTCTDLRGSDYSSCLKRWYGRGANAGITSAMAPYAESLLDDGERLETVESWFAAGATDSSSGQRYRHAVVRAMLATTDASLVKALNDMQMPLQENAVENKDFAEFSLQERYLGLSSFEKTLKATTPERFDNFLIALRVRGMLTGRLSWLYEETFLWFGDRPDLQRRFGSAAVIRKSEVIVQAFKDGTPLAAISLSQPADAYSANIGKSPKTFSFEDSKKPAAAVKGKNNTPAPFWEAAMLAGAGPNSKEKDREVAFEAFTGKLDGAGPNPKEKDREEQDKTGYLKGQPKQAVGGLSNFTVDNQQGSSDAVARIYLDGVKPAVRSMYVKKGETFSAKSLNAGTYIFRYRFIGSDDTFESDKPFSLTQTKTETGTRYSNVTVTLFKVRDGNMTTRKVDPSSF